MTLFATRTTIFTSFHVTGSEMVCLHPKSSFKYAAAQSVWAAVCPDNIVSLQLLISDHWNWKCHYILMLFKYQLSLLQMYPGPLKLLPTDFWGEIEEVMRGKSWSAGVPNPWVADRYRSIGHLGPGHTERINNYTRSGSNTATQLIRFH